MVHGCVLSTVFGECVPVFLWTRFSWTRSACAHISASYNCIARRISPERRKIYIVKRVSASVSSVLHLLPPPPTPPPPVSILLPLTPSPISCFTSFLLTLVLSQYHKKIIFFPVKPSFDVTYILYNVLLCHSCFLHNYYVGLNVISQMDNHRLSCARKKEFLSPSGNCFRRMEQNLIIRWQKT